MSEFIVLTGVALALAMLVLLALLRARRLGQPQNEVRLAVLGPSGAGKTLFLCSLVRRLTQTDELGSVLPGLHGQYLERTRELRELRRTEAIPEIPGPELLQHIREVLAERPELQESFRLEGAGESLQLQRKSTEGHWQPLAFFRENHRSTRDIVDSELARLVLDVHQGSLQVEDFLLLLQVEQDSERRLVRWWDVPGRYFRSDNPEARQRMALASGIFLILDGPRFLRGEIELDSSIDLMSARLELARQKKEKFPVWLILTKGDLLESDEQTFSPEEWRARAARLCGLEIGQGEFLEFFVCPVSVLPTASRPLRESIGSTFQSVYDCVLQQVLQTEKASRQKARRWRWAAAGFLLMALLAGGEALDAHRLESARNLRLSTAVLRAHGVSERIQLHTQRLQALQAYLQRPMAPGYWMLRRSKAQRALQVERRRLLASLDELAREDFVTPSEEANHVDWAPIFQALQILQETRQETASTAEFQRLEEAQKFWDLARDWRNVWAELEGADNRLRAGIQFFGQFLEAKAGPFRFTFEQWLQGSLRSRIERASELGFSQSPAELQAWIQALPESMDALHRWAIGRRDLLVQELWRECRQMLESFGSKAHAVRFRRLERFFTEVCQPLGGCSPAIHQEVEELSYSICRDWGVAQCRDWPPRQGPLVQQLRDWDAFAQGLEARLVEVFSASSEEGPLLFVALREQAARQLEALEDRAKLLTGSAERVYRRLELWKERIQTLEQLLEPQPAELELQELACRKKDKAFPAFLEVRSPRNRKATLVQGQSFLLEDWTPWHPIELEWIWNGWINETVGRQTYAGMFSLYDLSDAELSLEREDGVFCRARFQRTSAADLDPWLQVLLHHSRELRQEQKARLEEPAAAENTEVRQEEPS